MVIDMQAEAMDIADKIAELASERFGIPLTLDVKRFKLHESDPERWKRQVEKADLCFDLTGDRTGFQAACREPSRLADAFGVMEALAEGGGGKAMGAPARALYLIQVGDDPIVKVGVSANPYRRLMDLQKANYRELFLWGVVFSPKEKAMTLEQRTLELAFARGNRLMGEWVSSTPEAVFTDVLNMASEHKVAVCNAEVWLHNMMEQTKRMAKSKTYRWGVNQYRRGA